MQQINSIDSPIEHQNTGKGNPNAILHIGKPLNNRQQRLLDLLPEFDSRITVPKNKVNMKDLSALTAETGDEYAMFSKGKTRLIIRGDATKVRVNKNIAGQLANDGYRWSGHTHPGTDAFCLFPSDGDKAVLSCFRQMQSAIYNSQGKFTLFDKE